ncbi:MAG: hypothetical protein ACJAZA_001982, partial [Shewanella psychromarinicola]
MWQFVVTIIISLPHNRDGILDINGYIHFILPTSVTLKL